MLECIKKIAMQIIEELMDSNKYIHAAEKHKDEYPELADLYRDLSAEELKHAERLHEAGTRIADASEDHDAQVVWEWETERMEKWIKDIKVLHEMYK